MATTPEDWRGEVASPVTTRSKARSAVSVCSTVGRPAEVPRPRCTRAAAATPRRTLRVAPTGVVAPRITADVTPMATLDRPEARTGLVRWGEEADASDVAAARSINGTAPPRPPVTT